MPTKKQTTQPTWSPNTYAVDLVAAVTALGATGHLADVLDDILAAGCLDLLHLVWSGVVAVTPTVNHTLNHFACTSTGNSRGPYKQWMVRAHTHTHTVLPCRITPSLCLSSTHTATQVNNNSCLSWNGVPWATALAILLGKTAPKAPGTTSVKFKTLGTQGAPVLRILLFCQNVISSLSPALLPVVGGALTVTHHGFHFDLTYALTVTVVQHQTLQGVWLCILTSQKFGIQTWHMMIWVLNWLEKLEKGALQSDRERIHLLRE
jgi:hypothetical protein